MRVLEARFHPRRKTLPDVIVVGYLVWRGKQHDARPEFRAGAVAMPEPMMSKLFYLVDLTTPDPFERLQALRSDFWSFVEVDEQG